MKAHRVNMGYPIIRSSAFHKTAEQYDICNTVIVDILEDHARRILSADNADERFEALHNKPTSFINVAIRAREKDCRDSCRSHYDGLCARNNERYHLLMALNEFNKSRLNMELYLNDKWKNMLHRVMCDISVSLFTGSVNKNDDDDDDDDDDYDYDDDDYDDVYVGNTEFHADRDTRGKKTYGDHRDGRRRRRRRSK